MEDISDFAAAFLRMAERIRLNDPEHFGGAMLIVPPQGDPVDILNITTDPKGKEPRFWALCKAELDQTAAERLEELQKPDPFGRRR